MFENHKTPIFEIMYILCKLTTKRESYLKIHFLKKINNHKKNDSIQILLFKNSIFCTYLQKEILTQLMSELKIRRKSHNFLNIYFYKLKSKLVLLLNQPCNTVNYIAVNQSLNKSTSLVESIQGLHKGPEAEVQLCNKMYFLENVALIYVITYMHLNQKLTNTFKFYFLIINIITIII